MALLNDADETQEIYAYSYDTSTTLCPKLHIEYTAAVAAEPISLFTRHLATLRGE